MTREKNLAMFSKHFWFLEYFSDPLWLKSEDVGCVARASLPIPPHHVMLCLGSHLTSGLILSGIHSLTLPYRAAVADRGEAASSLGAVSCVALLDTRYHQKALEDDYRRGWHPNLTLHPLDLEPNTSPKQAGFLSMGFKSRVHYLPPGGLRSGHASSPYFLLPFPSADECVAHWITVRMKEIV